LRNWSWSCLAFSKYSEGHWWSCWGRRWWSSAIIFTCSPSRGVGKRAQTSYWQSASRCKLWKDRKRQLSQKPPRCRPTHGLVDVQFNTCRGLKQCRKVAAKPEDTVPAPLSFPAEENRFSERKCSERRPRCDFLRPIYYFLVNNNFFPVC
jgi:hypothetical protein